MAAAKSVNEKQFWREFISVYRSLPELWKVKSDEYKNRNKKDAAYEKLVVKMKEIEPKADRATVRAKINSLRTSYRRELRKIKESKKSGGGKDDAYLPNLWYFDDIDFLRDQETQIQGTSTMDNSEFSDEIEDTNDATVDEGSQSLQLQPGPARKRPLGAMKNEPRDSEDAKRARLLTLACERLQNRSSDAQIIAKGWGVEFGKMSPDQQLYAKKFIDDILFEGRLGNLHRDSITINNASRSLHNNHLTGYLPYPYAPHSAPCSTASSPSPSRISTHSGSSQYINQRAPANQDPANDSSR